MLYKRRPWQEELEIVDRVMRAVSDITEPEEMVDTYWTGIRELAPTQDFVSLSRRGVEPPEYLITRSSRFSEEINPWKERHRLPRMRGGLLGEFAYAEKPLVIDDLPSRLKADDPGRFYLEGFGSAMVLPQYEDGIAKNIGVVLFPPGVEFDRSFVPIMHWQASLFGRGTQSLVLRKQLTAALEELDRELQVVAEIQRSLLPRELPAIAGFGVAANYRTSARAGGDYYDFFPLSADEWGIFIADVSGHGTPAAVLMAITHAIAHTRPGSPKPPRELLAHLNRHLARSYTSSGTFVTAFYANLNVRTGHMAYASAGHNPPRLVRGKHVITLDGAGGLPLGVLEEAEFTDASVTIERGDVLALYTDGITETMGPMAADGSRPMFGVERLDGVLTAAPVASASEAVDRIRIALQEFSAGTPAHDDQTLVVLRSGA